MDGILNILKPPDMTSFDVVGYLRGVLGTKKIGHAGTLDPGAVGVLPIFTGHATKAIEFMTDKDKTYRAELTLGVSTDTQDSCGKVLEQHEVTSSHEDILKAVKSFLGKSTQVPPMYSAVKIGGKKLYELARSGITVERKPRDIEVYSIDVIRIWDSVSEARRCVKVMFDVECSKGTYIRTLCADIGDMLGCGGHMSFLVRLKAGVFDISTASTVEEIKELHRSGRLTEKIIRVDSIFGDKNKLVLKGADMKRILNGVPVRLGDCIGEPGETVRVYDERENFVLLGEIINSEGQMLLKSRKLFLQGENDGSNSKR